MKKETIEKNQVSLANPVDTGFRLAFGFWLFTLVLCFVLFILFMIALAMMIA